jgi:hypothetical protein
MGTNTPSDQDPRPDWSERPSHETRTGSEIPPEGLEILADGTWTYEGSPIRRMPLVKLFATVLRREGDRFWLKTPVEQVEIAVQDAPYVAVELGAAGSGQEQELRFRTNLDAWITVDDDHPLTVRRPRHPAVGDGDLVPYVEVKEGLEARLLRAVYYELVECGVEEMVDGRTRFGVWSGKRFFPLDRAPC